MKFNEKYPQFASLRLAYPGKLMGPHDEIAMIDALDTFQSFRGTECSVCRAWTSWRIELVGCPPAAICSEECHIRFLMGTADLEDLARVAKYTEKRHEDQDRDRASREPGSPASPAEAGGVGPTPAPEAGEVQGPGELRQEGADGGGLEESGDPAARLRPGHLAEAEVG